ncbi:hypothetical protein DMENIID0001_123890 [Sergentomyia squamirostris]
MAQTAAAIINLFMTMASSNSAQLYTWHLDELLFEYIRVTSRCYRCAARLHLKIMSLTLGVVKPFTH